jgi:hypothetical protein
VLVARADPSAGPFENSQRQRRSNAWRLRRNRLAGELQPPTAIVASKSGNHSWRPRGTEPLARLAERRRDWKMEHRHAQSQRWTRRPNRHSQ